MISAKIWPENGATSDGFSTMVQPVAMAGATLQTIWLSGQFQGGDEGADTIGSLTIIVGPRSSSNLKVLRISMAVERWPRPIGT